MHTGVEKRRGVTYIHLKAFKNAIKHNLRDLI